jgi:hypothetical protein
MLIIYLVTTFHHALYDYSFVSVIEGKTQYRFYASAVLFYGVCVHHFVLQILCSHHFVLYFKVAGSITNHFMVLH